MAAASLHLLPRHAGEDGYGSSKLTILLLFPSSHVLDLLWKVAVVPLATLSSPLTSHIPGPVSDKNVVEQWGEVSLEWGPALSACQACHPRL